MKHILVIILQANVKNEIKRGKIELEMFKEVY